MMRPKAVSVEATAAGRRGWLAVVLLVSLSLNSVGMRWGLPNDNRTWAADAIQPLTPLAVGKHAFFGERWSSGWFYFKYPLAHPQLLLAAQLPYLAWLRVSGQLSRPAAVYPYGFKHPEVALERLALLTRFVSALMGTAVVGLAYLTAAELFEATAGLAAGLLTAGCYPLVFYAHTSNVDVPVLFWIALALTASLQSARRDSRVATAVVGAAAAMALLTKEQSIGALAPIPLVWLLWRAGRRPFQGAALARHAAVALAAFLAVTLAIGNVWWNPAGYLNRWRFLLGTLPAEVRQKYAPYQFMVQVPKGFSLAHELQHATKVIEVAIQGVTWPVACLSLAGLVLGLWKYRRATMSLLLLAVMYHILSLRALELVPVRYTMPLLYALLLLAAAGVAALRGMLRQLPHPVSSVAAAALVLALLPGIDVTRLLLRDPRYAAESWLAERTKPGVRIEVYQPSTYLPRFSSEIEVKRIPVSERSITRFNERHPDYVVLSGGGRAGLTGHYAKDWKPGDPVFSDSQAAQAFFAALHGEQLGYRRLERFRTNPLFISPHINSLNPEITIYGQATTKD
ncbi:MAG: glycosyltransferase family 39 protein [Deltaproteobacteria bacterium]|nr:glycosyltransferase family 39 protein [Deltaproteobacteria bacterium]